MCNVCSIMYVCRDTFRNSNDLETTEQWSLIRTYVARALLCGFSN